MPTYRPGDPGFAEVYARWEAQRGRKSAAGLDLDAEVDRLCDEIVRFIGPITRGRKSTRREPTQREPTIAELRAKHQARQRRMAAEQARMDAAERDRQEQIYQAWRQSRLRNVCH